MNAEQTFTAAMADCPPGHRWLSLSPIESRVCMIALGLSLIARFQALLPGYSIDDYQFINQGLPEWFELRTARNGRSLAYVLFAALARLGIAPPRSSVIFTVLLSLVLVGIGIAACRLWGLSGLFAESLIVTCFTVLHPYQAEMFTFRTAVMISSISLALSFLALLAYPRSRLHWLLWMLMLAAGISLYQAVLNYIAMVLLFGMAFEYLRSRTLPAEWRRRAAGQVGMVVAAVAVYGVSTMMVSRLSRVELGARTNLIGVHELGGRISAFGVAAFKVLAGEEPILPLACKILLLLTFAIGAAAFIFTAIRRQRDRPWLRMLVLPVAAILGLPLCFGIILATREWWIPPRMLSQTSIYWGGLMAMVYLFTGRRVRRVLTGGFVLILAAFIGLNEQIFADQLRLNLRDMAEANRIVTRLELLPNFREIETVVLSGGFWGYASPIRTMEGDMNTSALYVEWAKVFLLNEASGYAFHNAHRDVKLRIAPFCEASPKWPAVGSVSTQGPIAIVCLPKDAPVFPPDPDTSIP